MNAFDLACAVLSSTAYQTGFNDLNKVPEVPGAVQLPGDLGYKTTGGISGFEASAFEYDGKIVIAYKGTDFLTGLESRSWNTVADLVADVSLAFTKDGLGSYNGQQLLASSYFLAVKDWAAQSGYDGNKISFTGHSVGGGLGLQHGHAV
jgi:putative lipase involved disintegration of autophagic bodies